MIKLTTKQRIAIIKYNSAPKGCEGIFCKQCPLHISQCLLAEAYKHTLSIQGAAQRYMRKHPKDFSPEQITEAFL